ncbi:MAG: hypothetical protein SVX43_22345, partial [Cyanobacteriota bacterium]|nr:hypothetical protein [Cyanobacteriota bacterium]
MLRFVLKRKRIRGAIAAVLAMLASSCSLPGAKQAERSAETSENAPRSRSVSEQDRPACAIANPLAAAVAKAQSAATLAQRARTPQDWDAVVLEWMQAIAAMQSVPVASPQRVFAQKKVIEYQQNLIAAQQKS